MARVTVEDCVDKIQNRFELVMMAAQRARGISAGAELTVDRDNDKNPVVSLREIAESTVSAEELTEELIKSSQTFVAMDEPDDEDMDLLGIHEDVIAEGSGDPNFLSGIDETSTGSLETDTDQNDSVVAVIGTDDAE